MSLVRLCNYTVNSILESRSEAIPWGIEKIGATSYWSKAKGSGIVVAILDTGCDCNHQDLKNQIIAGRNFTTDYNGDPNNYMDQQGHGTHVAGTVAAAANGVGVVGVGPDIKILVGKVLTNQGAGDSCWIAQGVRWATAWRGAGGERVRVISMSLGGPDDDPALHRAIKDAVDAGILVVCAAGNDGPGHREYPGSYSEVVEVGATDERDHIANFSNTNPELDLVAPGVNILSTYINNGYAVLSGSSMATPHISAAAALIILDEEQAYKRELTEAEVFAFLIKRTRDLGYPKTDQGAGLLSLTATGNKRFWNIYIARDQDDYIVHVGRRKDTFTATGLARDLEVDLVAGGSTTRIIQEAGA